MIRAKAGASGNALYMTVLLVDDRDGKIVSEIETEDEAQRVLQAWLRDDGSLPEYLCLIELDSHHGALVGTDKYVKIRPLT
jgi:hypothetical protein